MCDKWLCVEIDGQLLKSISIDRWSVGDFSCDNCTPFDCWDFEAVIEQSPQLLGACKINSTFHSDPLYHDLVEVGNVFLVGLDGSIAEFKVYEYATQLHIKDRALKRFGELIDRAGLV